MAALYKEELRNVRSAQTLPSSPGSNQNIPQCLVTEYKKCMSNRLVALYIEVTSEAIQSYNNLPVYADVSELQPKLIHFEHLAKDENFEIQEKDAITVLLQMAKPLHGVLDFAKRLADPDQRHYLTFLATTHMYQSWHNVDRNDIPNMMRADTIEITQYYSRRCELREKAGAIVNSINFTKSVSSLQPRRGTAGSPAAQAVPSRGA